MALFSKPNRVAEWNSGLANQTEPTGGKKILGWIFNEAPASSFFNWLGFQAYTWFRWFDQRHLDGSFSPPSSYRVQAPDPALAADPGGDMELAAAPAGSTGAFGGQTIIEGGNAEIGDGGKAVMRGGDGGTGGVTDNKSGGGVLLEGGTARGDQSSSITMRVATAGASGNGLRPVTDYLTVDGVNGQITSTKPVIANGLGTKPAIQAIGDPSGSGPGVEGKTAGTGHGIVAEAVAADPVKSALRIVPQDDDPTSPVEGDVLSHSVTNKLAHYDGVTFEDIGRKRLITLADATTLINPTGSPIPFDQSYAIPGNTLREGSIVRVRAWGSFFVKVASDIEFNITYGGSVFPMTVGITGATPNLTHEWMLEGHTIVRSIATPSVAPSVSAAVVRAAVGAVGIGGVAIVGVSASTGVKNLNTLGPLTIDLRVRYVVSDAAHNFNMHGFIVEIA